MSLMMLATIVLKVDVSMARGSVMESYGSGEDLHSHPAEKKDPTDTELLPKGHVQLGCLTAVSVHINLREVATYPIQRHCQDQTVSDNIWNSVA